MTPSPSTSPGIALVDLVSQLHELLAGTEDRPSQAEIREVCDVLYAASLLKEEGRAVRARVLIAPPDAFAATEGPPDGVHAIRFKAPHNFTPNEIKRLSPAARNVIQVGHAHDLEGTRVSAWNVQGDGTRHRSVYRLCSVEPEVIGFVISQDSQVRMIANVDDLVVFWPHTVV